MEERFLSFPSLLNLKVLIKLPLARKGGEKGRDRGPSERRLLQRSALLEGMATLGEAQKV